MDANPVVFDVSSDEGSPSPPLVGDGPPMPDYEYDVDWIRDILDNLDAGETVGGGQNRRRDDGGDSDDEVVILGESRDPPKPGPRPKPTRVGSGPMEAVSDGDGDDEDCVVLDGDPDNPSREVDGGVGSRGGDDDDDVLVVGQKGQVACRDYPHLRHLCVRFPFKSTPHSIHCELCYCYVCDAPAPCARWGSGDASVDHCHATDKLEMWKTLRKNFRPGLASPSLAAPPNTMISGAAMTQVNQITPGNNVCQPPSSLSQRAISRMIPMRPCSSSSSFGVPSIASRSRNQTVGLMGRNGFVSHAVSNQALRVHRSIIGKGTSPVGNLNRPAVSHSSVIFERPGIVSRASVKNTSVNGSTRLRNHAPVSQYATHSASSSRDNNHGGPQNVLPGVVSESFGNPTLPIIGANSFGSGLSATSTFQPNQNIDPVGNQNQHLPVLPGVDFNWFLSGYNLDTTSGNFQLQDVATNNEPTPAQFPGVSHCHSWFADQPIPVTSEYCMPPDMSLFPSELTTDPGMLYFDFETSWHGLTHA